jgi:hypothetical protein
VKLWNHHPRHRHTMIDCSGERTSPLPWKRSPCADKQNAIHPEENSSISYREKRRNPTTPVTVPCALVRAQQRKTCSCAEQVEHDRGALCVRVCQRDRLNDRFAFLCDVTETLCDARSLWPPYAATVTCTIGAPRAPLSCERPTIKNDEGSSLCCRPSETVLAIHDHQWTFDAFC